MSYLGSKKRGMAAKAFEKAIKLGKGTRVGEKATVQLDKMKAASRKRR